MVFQSYALFPNMTVEGNIAFGLKMKKLASDEIQREVTKVIELVDLKGKENTTHTNFLEANVSVWH